MDRIVLDTNVFIAALLSRRGAAYKLLLLLVTHKFENNISVPLILEYEAIAERLLHDVALTSRDIAEILDYICTESQSRQVFFLWRPFLKDPKDDIVLELAVTGNCDFIVTYNPTDFKGIEQFGILTITPKAFLERIGEVP
jgi:putative PIN family toxin of toxin-antitoxin system